MSRKGDCWDNAPMESFFHTLKTELVMHCDYKTREDARLSLFDYMLGEVIAANRGIGFLIEYNRASSMLPACSRQC